MTRLLPLVRFHLDGSPARAALDLDAPNFAVGIGGEQVEAGPVGQAREARPLGLGDVFDGRPALLLPSDGDTHRDLLDARVMAFLLLGVTRGYHENMGEKADFAGDDSIGRAFDSGECAFLLGR